MASDTRSAAKCGRVYRGGAEVAPVHYIDVKQTHRIVKEKQIYAILVTVGKRRGNIPPEGVVIVKRLRQRERAYAVSGHCRGDSPAVGEKFRDALAHSRHLHKPLSSAFKHGAEPAERGYKLLCKRVGIAERYDAVKEHFKELMVMENAGTEIPEFLSHSVAVTLVYTGHTGSSFLREAVIPHRSYRSICQ